MKGFAKVDSVFGKQLKSRQKKNAKMTMRKIQNEVIPCIVKVIRREIWNTLETPDITRWLRMK